MKKVTTNQLNGEYGETLVRARVMKLGHVFQGTGRMETGIDGTIEFRDPQTGQMTGKMVAVQVKTREKGEYTAESDSSLRRRGSLTAWENGRRYCCPWPSGKRHCTGGRTGRSRCLWKPPAPLCV